MPTAQLLTGNNYEVLQTLPAGSVHCVVTSPPYFGLRDYGVAGQIGLEPTPEEYVSRLVSVFNQVRRVLRDDGTLWLNLGDSYAGGGVHAAHHANPGISQAARRGADVETPVPDGLKPKDLIGIPWRVAFALQSDGWYLRSDIIWAKPNPMPESVTDRPTKAHEYVFLMSKRARYFYDTEAIKETSITPAGETWEERKAKGAKSGWRETGRFDIESGRTFTNLGRGGFRNARTIWEIATEPYPGAHFAVFPSNLVKPCILAGTSSHGVCEVCGAPWERVIEKPDMTDRPRRSEDAKYQQNEWTGVTSAGQAYQEWRNANPNVTVGWRATCDHNAPAVPATVLDPFSGSGTTAAVALSLGRNAVGIELNPTYTRLAERRVAEVTPALFGL